MEKILSAKINRKNFLIGWIFTYSFYGNSKFIFNDIKKFKDVAHGRSASHWLWIAYFEFDIVFRVSNILI